MKDYGIIKVQRIYKDGLQDKAIDERTKFIEALTHDMLVVQLSYFKQKSPGSDIEKN